MPVPSYADKVGFVRDLLRRAFDDFDRRMFDTASVQPSPIGHPSREVRVLAQTITKCYHECPFFQLDGGPSPMMVCGHPSLKGKGIEECAIISHPDCDNGFPAKCPLMTNGDN